MKGKNIKYIPAVDQLRGLAAILIIFYHGLHLITYQLRFGTPFTFENWLTTDNVFLAPLIEGHTAVALFMVLSGFIFTHGAAGADIRYSSFLYNRFLRIFPLFLFLYIVGIYLFPEHYSFLGLLQGLLLQSNLPGATFIEPFTSLFWTIAVEFQFYIVFPFLLLFQRRYGVRYLLFIMLLFSVIRIFGLILGANVREFSYGTILGRMDQFIFGMLIALLFRTHKLRWQIALVCLAASAACLAIALVYFHRLGGYPMIAWYKILWPTLEGLLWACFIYSYLNLFQTIQPMLMNVLAWIGELSYSLYLTHLIVIVILLRQHFFALPIPNSIIESALLTTLLLVFPLALLLALLTYHLIEKPFLELRRVYLQRPLDGPSIAKSPID
ncbi:MAG: acyltransferase [Roseiflexaceae bacterium]|nr:acyltransferase [Roseiflexaceae bacterium]